MIMSEEYYTYMNGNRTGAPGAVLRDADALGDWYSMLDMGGEL